MLAAIVAIAAACMGERDPRTPEEAAARGDQLLRRMSDTLKQAQSFSFTVNEAHERVRRNGQKEPYWLKRDVIVRRPDRLFSHTTGSDDREIRVTSDGKNVTVVGDKLKIYAPRAMEAFARAVIAREQRQERPVETVRIEIWRADISPSLEVVETPFRQTTVAAAGDVRTSDR